MFCVVPRPTVVTVPHIGTAEFVRSCLWLKEQSEIEVQSLVLQSRAS